MNNNLLTFDIARELKEHYRKNWRTLTGMQWATHITDFLSQGEDGMYKLDHVGDLATLLVNRGDDLIELLNAGRVYASPLDVKFAYRPYNPTEDKNEGSRIAVGVGGISRGVAPLTYSITRLYRHKTARTSSPYPYLHLLKPTGDTRSTIPHTRTPIVDEVLKVFRLQSLVDGEGTDCSGEHNCHILEYRTASKTEAFKTGLLLTSDVYSINNVVTSQSTI